MNVKYVSSPSFRLLLSDEIGSPASLWYLCLTHLLFKTFIVCQENSIWVDGSGLMTLKRSHWISESFIKITKGRFWMLLLCPAHTHTHTPRQVLEVEYSWLNHWNKAYHSGSWIHSPPLPVAQGFLSSFVLPNRHYVLMPAFVFKNLFQLASWSQKPFIPPGLQVHKCD